MTGRLGRQEIRVLNNFSFQNSTYNTRSGTSFLKRHAGPRTKHPKNLIFVPWWQILRAELSVRVID